MAGKIKYMHALELVEDGIMTEDSLRQGIQRGYIARKPGTSGPLNRKRKFVSEAQEEFHLRKNEVINTVRDFISNSPVVSGFFADYGYDHEVNGKSFRLDVHVLMKGANRVFNAFQPEEMGLAEGIKIPDPPTQPPVEQPEENEIFQ